MNNFLIGATPVIVSRNKPTGQFIQIAGEEYYEIKNYDNMLPFFISIAGESDLWMYLSSTGGLSAGRKNPDTALFPYYTDDKISESFEQTGSKTIFRVKKEDKVYLWEPFSDRYKGIYALERSIAKSTIGNKIIFKEKNLDLGLTFCYAWMNADAFGWIKKSRISNDGNSPVELTVLDGLQNILPSGIDRLTQNTFSTLVDGYKRTELAGNAPLALFRMESILVDRAEPSESLRANTVWLHGLDEASFLLSSRQLDAFRMGMDITPETEAKGVRGAMFACASDSLPAAAEKTWYFVAEVNQDAVKVNNLILFIQQTKNISALLKNEIARGTEALKQIVAGVDGIQETADEHGMARHFSNVLFNTMRGGFYCEDYTINGVDFYKHVRLFNRKVAERHDGFLRSLPDSGSYTSLEEEVLQQNDKQLYRLFQEYLPLTFSRRHGDPSRPWNVFNIKVKDENGNKLISYQGNWRDIFQNWEALSLSYPAYITGIIAKFLNATTADGYNPYKVTNEGIDWEVIEPENPWSNIGYWGDHQIIYLLKLLEISEKYYPERVLSWLNKDMFAFANVPYKLKTYAEIVAEPKNSIRFDDVLHHSIEKLLPDYGADARLMLDEKGEVILVNFTEKLLATLLAKLSNFVPEAGIWMNTLRPEWNDANNALVGYGSSMVTLYYMRRFVAFAQQLYRSSSEEELSISAEICEFFKTISDIFERYSGLLEKGFDDRRRRNVADDLGNAGEAYRTRIYGGFSGRKQALAKADLDKFFTWTLSYIDQSIKINKRPDGMYHAYNLVNFTDNSVVVRHLYEMLEGQVAVLSSLELSPEEAADLLDALRNSALYRPDQQSYILYPNKRLPSFLGKNNIAKEDVQRIDLLQKLLAAGDTRIVAQDKKGEIRFNADFNNASFLQQALNDVKKEAAFRVTEQEERAVLDLYEKIFNHQAFTGRSGTFYKYEGLGCIYWHMVSKLLLAVGENIRKAVAEKADAGAIDRLKNRYAEIKRGIGAHKSPEDYGSFPFDPYSHTPMMAGVQQPGMTGQVKEDIISRFFELGISVDRGKLSIKPDMLDKAEFKTDGAAPYLSFSYCSVPFTYIIDGAAGIDIQYAAGKTEQTAEYTLSEEQSKKIFNRDKEIEKVVVHFHGGKIT